MQSRNKLDTLPYLLYLSPAVHGEKGQDHRDDAHQLPEDRLHYKDQDAGDEEEDQCKNMEYKPVNEEPPGQSHEVSGHRRANNKPSVPQNTKDQ